MARAHVFSEQREEIGGTESGALVGLSHQVADVDFDGPRLFDGLSHVLDQEIGQHAGVDVSGAKHDSISLGDSVKHGRIGICFGVQINVVYGHVEVFATGVNSGFAN